MNEDDESGELPPPGWTQVRLARARVGDQEAWRELFEALRPALLTVARSEISARGIRAITTPEDVLGETFERVAARSLLGQGRFDYEGPGSLARFLRQVVRNVAADSARRARAAKRPPNVQAASGNESGMARSEITAFRVVAPDPTPTSIARLSEIRELIEREPGLGPEAWALLEECKLSGYSSSEIGAALDRAPGTVRWRLKQVVDRVRELLARRGYGPRA
jgi:RNA polymerase sigma factor (sigma-70 family)